jgi:hypothetical protein
MRLPSLTQLTQQADLTELHLAVSVLPVRSLTARSQVPKGLTDWSGNENSDERELARSLTVVGSNPTPATTLAKASVAGTDRTRW